MVNLKQEVKLEGRTYTIAEILLLSFQYLRVYKQANPKERELGFDIYNFGDTWVPGLLDVFVKDMWTRVGGSCESAAGMPVQDRYKRTLHFQVGKGTPLGETLYQAYWQVGLPIGALIFNQVYGVAYIHRSFLLGEEHISPQALELIESRSLTLGDIEKKLLKLKCSNNHVDALEHTVLNHLAFEAAKDEDRRRYMEGR